MFAVMIELTEYVFIDIVGQQDCIALNDRSCFEMKFPVIGQGILIFHKDVKTPFSISVEDKIGDYRLVLHIEKDKVLFIKWEGGTQRTLSFTQGKECGLENGKIAYWYSYDRDNLILKYGKGYRMEETTILSHNFLEYAASEKERKEVRKTMHPYFNPEEQRYIRLYESITFNSNGKFI